MAYFLNSFKHKQSNLCCLFGNNQFRRRLSSARSRRSWPSCSGEQGSSWRPGHGGRTSFRTDKPCRPLSRRTSAASVGVSGDPISCPVDQWRSIERLKDRSPAFVRFHFHFPTWLTRNLFSARRPYGNNWNMSHCPSPPVSSWPWRYSCKKEARLLETDSFLHAVPPFGAARHRTKPCVEKFHSVDAEIAGHAHKLDVKLQSLFGSGFSLFAVRMLARPCHVNGVNWPSTLCEIKRRVTFLYP